MRLPWGEIFTEKMEDYRFICDCGIVSFFLFLFLLLGGLFVLTFAISEMNALGERHQGSMRTL